LAAATIEAGGLFRPGDLEGFPKHGPVSRNNPWMFAVSLAAHGLFLLALILFTHQRPVEPPPVRSIDVQIISLPSPSSSTATAPSPNPPPVALTTPGPNSMTSPPVQDISRKAPPAVATPSAGSGMSHPTHLLAGAYIRDPASLEIRQNLPRLAPNERVTQLCNIEAGQQIQAAAPKTLVDTVHASALGDTSVDGLTITAPQAAYRSHRKWYAVSFICTVAPDFKTVTDFKFKVGDAIPRGLWDAHYLNAADENE
jgi:hypothetical protein